MKILLCTNAFENITNGPAKFANLLLEINDLYPEHEVHVLTEDVSSPKTNVHFIKLTIPTSLKPIGQVLRMFQYHKEAMRIKKSVFDFDVLVYNNAFIGLWSALKYSRTIGMINDDNNALSAFTDLFKGQRHLKQYIFKQLEHLSARFHKRIITNSKYLTNQLLNTYPCIQGKERLMYKSIDIIRYENKEEIHNPVRILFVKNDFLRGGLFDLIEALGKVNFSYTLTVIGPSKEFFPAIKFKADECNVEVTLLGPQSQLEVFEHMKKSDIFCVPSHKEALGVANMEAMAVGMAVVSANAGGIPEVLNGGRNGWLVNPGDPIALSLALNECVSSPALRKEKKTAAKEYLGIFSKYEMFKRFLEITNELK
jgi:colanic acid/amylovoran biosynthesis glycosyltransferase